MTMSYVMTVSSGITLPTSIVNTALINDGLGNVHIRTVVALANGLAVYLPIIRR
jgi:hypothetical protein